MERRLSKRCQCGLVQSGEQHQERSEPMRSIAKEEGSWQGIEAVQQERKRQERGAEVQFANVGKPLKTTCEAKVCVVDGGVSTS